MTNKEKYPNAEIKGPCAFGYYIVLDNDNPSKTTYLVNNAPSIKNCTNGWHSTREQAESALNNFMNETPEITLKEIKRQYEEAKKLIGKTVSDPGGWKVKVEEVILDLLGEYSSQLCNEFFEKHGYVIKVCGRKGGWKIPFSPEIKAIETVTVTAHDGQTYTAESDGDCWKFGCARISKPLIRKAYDLFLQSSIGNRQLEKITIEKCDFTRETLKALAELEN